MDNHKELKSVLGKYYKWCISIQPWCEYLLLVYVVYLIPYSLLRELWVKKGNNKGCLNCFQSSRKYRKIATATIRKIIQASLIILSSDQHFLYFVSPYFHTQHGTERFVGDRITVNSFERTKRFCASVTVACFFHFYLL